MNCREFLIEFEERGSLSEAATLHLTICTDCRKSSDEQTRVWLMIEGLKQIAAPPDFDFRVKAKIANAKPADFAAAAPPRFLPALRYVLPACAAFLLLGLVIFNAVNFSGNDSAPTIAKGRSETPAANFSPSNQLSFAPPEIVNTSIETLPVETKQPEVNQNAQFIVNKLPRNRRASTPKPSFEKESGGGSRDFASTGTREILPNGIKQNKTITSAPNLQKPKQVNDEEILSVAGIETITENGKRTVKTVQQNSLAARSGVKAGDVIEKINDRAGSGKSLTVTRASKKIEIVLQNRPDQ